MNSGRPVLATGIERLWRSGEAPENFKYPGLNPRTEMHGDIRVDYDVPVTLRDGNKIFVDVFRPAGETEVPVIIGWSPYGKHGAIEYDDVLPGADVDTSKLSSDVIFEAPDPGYWCAAGYAVIYPDPRGSWGSEGDASFGTAQEVEDCCDLIEWAGTQPWSTGKVGLGGVSYLAWIQWQVAAARPKHLAAINPVEGVSDFYRELYFHGGIPETKFIPLIAHLWGHSRGRVEDLEAMRELHPLLDDYWREKNAVLSSIDVPAYVVASWTDHALHSRGTLEAFKEISSPQKWLEVHGRKKWQYYYGDESVDRQRQFFDHFLKGADSGIDAWPKVRLEVRDRSYVGSWQEGTEWPPSRTAYRKLYLDGGTGNMTTQPLPEEQVVHYDPSDHSAGATFDFQFEEETNLVGHSKLRLWVEADGSDDMDLFVALQKIDAEGKKVDFPYYSTRDDGNVALGWLRVSHRELSEKSTPEQPILRHERELRLERGEIVPVEIEIWPSGTRFAPGESLRVVIKGQDINQYPANLLTPQHVSDRNRGTHILHTGGRYDAHLLVPVLGD